MSNTDQGGIPSLEDGPVLVTGAAGFMGGHIMRELQLGSGDVAADVSVEYQAPKDIRKLEWILPQDAPDSLGEVRYIVHLAAMSSVSESLRNPRKAYLINLLGTLSVLDFMVSRCPNARLLFVSSAEVYSPSGSLLAESCPIGPINPYGSTKAACEIALFQYARNHDLDIVVARPFPHFGTGQSKNFVFSSFCRRIIDARKSGIDVIKAGNLNPVRDYLYVTDVARAYGLLLAEGEKGQVYNICSGTGTSIGDMVNMLIDIADYPVSLQSDPQLMRPVDVEYQVGDPSRMKSIQGWEPLITRREGLTRLYRWWEERT